ncbi:hypothetical protein [Dyadobacter sp. CY326]|uniref:hypothetical protein n=1 Tax=Dyadobacter sp. CY326 TaxID=2907300 RepID=UPI001F48F7A9|nr:hypothetical protein [Dyadobacter sp. CY326]MCE7066361.1 hypothetical protein [Dyadobacter sp. CY326]
MAISISCSKKDHEVKPPENCRFAGKTYRLEQLTSGYESTETYESHIQQDDEGRLTEFSVLQTRDQNPGKQFPITVNEGENYTFKYDSEGFLVEIKRHEVINHTGNISYNDYGQFKKGRIETDETTTFIYANKLIESYQRKTLTVVKGDENPPKNYEYEAGKTYKYDAQGVIQQTISTNRNGDKSITTFQNGIRATTINQNGTLTAKYDEKGRTASSGNVVIAYDDNDNIILYQTYVQSNLNFTDKRTYDDKINPESLIPFRFKGIPDDMPFLRYTEGKNNQVKSTYSYPSQDGYTKNIVWEYNSTGLPTTSTSSIDKPGSVQKQVTTYRYENCN